MGIKNLHSNMFPGDAGELVWGPRFENTVLMHAPSGSRVACISEFPGELQDAWTFVSAAHALRLIYFTWNTAWALKFLRDPKVMLCTGKFRNSWYHDRLSSPPSYPFSSIWLIF